MSSNDVLEDSIETEKCILKKVSNDDTSVWHISNSLVFHAQGVHINDASLMVPQNMIQLHI